MQTSGQCRGCEIAAAPASEVTFSTSDQLCDRCTSAFQAEMDAAMRPLGILGETSQWDGILRGAVVVWLSRRRDQHLMARFETEILGAFDQLISTLPAPESPRPSGTLKKNERVVVGYANAWQRDILQLMRDGIQAQLRGNEALALELSRRAEERIDAEAAKELPQTPPGMIGRGRAEIEQWKRETYAPAMNRAGLGVRVCLDCFDWFAPNGDDRYCSKGCSDRVANRGRNTAPKKKLSIDKKFQQHKATCARGCKTGAPCPAGLAIWTQAADQLNRRDRTGLSPERAEEMMRAKEGGLKSRKRPAG